MKIDDLAQGQVDRAMQKYHANYDNDTYKKATDGKSVEYANRLTDNALALCGHPDYRVDRYEWSVEALDFLRWFTDVPSATFKKVMDYVERKATYNGWYVQRVKLDDTDAPPLVHLWFSMNTKSYKLDAEEMAALTRKLIDLGYDKFHDGLRESEWQHPEV